MGSQNYIPSVYRDPTEEAFSADYIKKIVNRGFMTPGQKYREPQTSSQEVGWMHSPVVKRPTSSIRRHCAKSRCFETSFAEEYFKYAGDNPYKVRTRSVSKVS